MVYIDPAVVTAIIGKYIYFIVFRKHYISYRPSSLRSKRIIFRSATWLIVLSFVFGTGWFFFADSGYFSVRTVAIEGLHSVRTDDVDQFVRQSMVGTIHGLISRDHYVAVATDEIGNGLLERFPVLSAAMVDKELMPLRLSIALTERTYEGLWCGTAGQCFLLDDLGVIYAEAPNASGSLVLVVRDSRNVSPGLGDEVIIPKHVSALKSLRESLYARSGVFSQAFRYDGGKDVNIETSEGWTLRVPIDAEPQDAALSVSETLREIGMEKRGEIEYIDLRIAGRAYYKLRSEEVIDKQI